LQRLGQLFLKCTCQTVGDAFRRLRIILNEQTVTALAFHNTGMSYLRMLWDGNTGTTSAVTPSQHIDFIFSKKDPNTYTHSLKSRTSLKLRCN